MGFSKKLSKLVSDRLQEKGFTQKQTEEIIEVMTEVLTSSRIKHGFIKNEKKAARDKIISLYRVNFWIQGTRGKEYRREEVMAKGREQAKLDVMGKYPECRIASAWKVNV